MSNLPTISMSALNYEDQKVLKAIRETIAPNATDAEFAMFIGHCKGTQLNPFKKETWFIKTEDREWRDRETGKLIQVPGKVQIMTGINGYYTVANNHPQYDGMEPVKLEFDDTGKIVSATAVVWRKDRKFPSTATAYWDEFYPGPPAQGKKPGIWHTKGKYMIAKVAESHALRKAFPQELNGTYTQEEMPPEYGPTVTLDTPPADPAKKEEKSFLEKAKENAKNDTMPDWDKPKTETHRMPDNDNMDEPIKKTPLQLMEDAVDGEDIGYVGNWQITSSPTHKGKTVKELFDEYPEWVQKALTQSRSKLNKIDALAMDYYNDVYPVNI